MDYFDLLHQAQMNNKNVTVKETRCYKATFTAPKKAEKSRVSSDNIKKFLARKEEEEKKKVLDEQKKKEELLALRSLDKKAQKRVQTMLKRTKSANKSVMEDAIDNFNTKDTLEGPKQCDEDDYGYVSQEASAFYEKLMAKYEKAPVENLKQMTREVKDLKAAKDRVKAALDKEADELLHPTRKRKRKHDDDGFINDDENDMNDFDNSSDNIKFKSKEEDKEETKEKLKKIPKKNVPPPVDFFELMKIAAKKQHEPIVIEKKVEKPDERPMTKKEKLEHQKQIERLNRKNDPKGGTSSKPCNEKSSRDSIPSKNQTKSSSKPISDKPEPSKLRSILKDAKDKSEASGNTTPQFKKKELKFGQSSDKLPPIPKMNSNGFKGKSQETLKSNSDEVTCAPSKNSLPSSKIKSEKLVEKTSPKVNVSDIDREIEMLMKKKQMLMNAAKSQKVSSPSQSSREPPQKPSQNSAANKISGNKPSSSAPVRKPSLEGKNGVSIKGNINDREKCRSKFNSDKGQVPSKNFNDRDKIPQKIIKSEPKPPPGARKFSPPRYAPTSRSGPPQLKRKQNKRVIDSESEYDSEMDDFIDDGPEDCMDYSQHIKEIFGYDKHRYANVDEDECEESSFRTQMIEERRSAKIGLMEDLEDIQREKEEKARAKMKKKMKR